MQENPSRMKFFFKRDELELYHFGRPAMREGREENYREGEEEKRDGGS